MKGRGPLMADVAGTRLSAEDRERLQHPLFGGVILFSRNFESRQQLRELTHSIRALRSPDLLIAVDHEGGRIQRFREGYTALPAASRLGVLYETRPEAACELAQCAGQIMASELREDGVHFSFAPVLDLGLGISEVIGDRAFGPRPETVVRLARAYILGMKQAGMAATGKHFPGHGGVAADSHVDVPVDLRSLEALREQDLEPFRVLAPELSAIMPAHVIYPACDPLPAGFSRFWLQTILRTEMAFDGAIFSDDLSMAGASAIGGGIIERAEAATEAGCDMVLVCNDTPAAEQLLDRWRPGKAPDRERRLAAMAGTRESVANELARSRTRLAALA